MTEVEKLRKDIELKEKWLRERKIIEDGIKATKDHNFYIGYWRESSSWDFPNHQYKTNLPKHIAVKLTKLLEQELIDFDKLGYEGWLKEQDKGD